MPRETGPASGMGTVERSGGSPAQMRQPAEPDLSPHSSIASIKRWSPRQKGMTPNRLISGAFPMAEGVGPKSGGISGEVPQKDVEGLKG